MRGKNGTNVYTGLLPSESSDSSASYAWVDQRNTNLNEVKILNHDGPAEALDVTPVTAHGMTVCFRDIEDALVHHIEKADAILGCVAWLTNKRILAALAQKNPVSIIVQKEDFLRPDTNSSNGWVKEMRRRYDSLQCTWDRFDFGIYLSTLGDQSLAPVRCVGNYNRDKLPAFPRMHHKFVVFCRCSTRTLLDEIAKQKREGPILEPYAVWTGSYNFTENAGRSLENAVLMTDPDIINAYWDEWERILALSEPLDWESDWVAPEWRLGS